MSFLSTYIFLPSAKMAAPNLVMARFQQIRHWCSMMIPSLWMWPSSWYSRSQMANQWTNVILVRQCWCTIKFRMHWRRTPVNGRISFEWKTNRDYWLFKENYFDKRLCETFSRTTATGNMKCLYIYYRYERIYYILFVRRSENKIICREFVHSLCLYSKPTFS